MYENFKALCDHLRNQGISDPPRRLISMGEDEMPEEYRDTFRFWASLSGPSRNLFYNVAHGKQTKKKFAKK